MSRYFQKEIPDAPVYVNGHPLRFDLLETSDPMLISELENCIRRSAGGISELSEERFTEEVKKKELETASGTSLRPSLKRTELSALHLGNPGVAVASRFARQEGFQPPQPAAHQMPDPIEVPTAASFSPPPVAKMKDLKAMMERSKPK